MKRKYDKAHKEWARQVKAKYNYKCIVCGETKILNAHHLIPWEIAKFRHTIMNGVPLCAKHHTRYGSGLSPHSHGSILFYFFLKNNFPDILEWVEDNYDL